MLTRLVLSQGTVTRQFLNKPSPASCGSSSWPPLLVAQEDRGSSVWQPVPVFSETHALSLCFL